MPADPKLPERLESMGEDAVRRDFILGIPNSGGPEHVEAVRLWLASKEAARTAASSARKEAREEESLSISRKSLATSISARRWAIIAIVVSTANIAITLYIKYTATIP